MMGTRGRESCSPYRRAAEKGKTERKGLGPNGPFKGTPHDLASSH